MICKSMMKSYGNEESHFPISLQAQNRESGLASVEILAPVSVAGDKQATRHDPDAHGNLRCKASLFEAGST
jgi:hypothetical protein